MKRLHAVNYCLKQLLIRTLHYLNKHPSLSCHSWRFTNMFCFLLKPSFPFPQGVNPAKFACPASHLSLWNKTMMMKVVPGLMSRTERRCWWEILLYRSVSDRWQSVAPLRLHRRSKCMARIAVRQPSRHWTPLAITSKSSSLTWCIPVCYAYNHKSVISFNQYWSSKLQEN